jgi:energy-coupling factor transporter ATP-binding protein EcfA2
MEIMNHLPVQSASFDKLGFQSKAQEIATFINNYPSRLPCSISINGPWGSGKSTMLNLIEELLHTEKCRIIRFNPWMVTDRESLINNLFEEIYFEIDGGFTKAKGKFAAYAEKIVPSAVKLLTYFGAASQGVDPRSATMIGNSAGEAAKGVGDLLFDKPLSKRKKELYDSMELITSENEDKIVIMIDELDRLFPEEIITVFQMIKSSLDFPGLFFVVAMDETVVHEAIQKQGISKPDYYLQKIFQRSYYINTKFQIKTLVDNFLLCNLDESNDSDAALLECLEVFIYYERDKYVEHIFQGPPEEYDSTLVGKYEWAPYDKNTKSDISAAYSSISQSLIENLNLNNPRTFIKFSYQLREIWPSYYDNIITDNGKYKFCIHAAFVILISQLTNPTYTETKYLLKGFVVDRDNKVPDYVKNVRDFLFTILPRVIQSSVNNNNAQARRLDTVVRTAVFYLNQFPDYLRGTQILESTPS